MGIGCFDDVLLAVEGLGRFALQRGVELLEGFDLAGGLRVGHFGHNCRVLEDFCTKRMGERGKIVN